MQLNTSKMISFFHEVFKEKFGLDDYISRDKPTLFFGIYRRADLSTLREHIGPKIVWFAGSDAKDPWMLRNLKEAKELQEDTYYIAESKWIEKDLDKFGIKYEKISILNGDMDKWKETPLGNSVYWYSAGQSKYGKHLFKEVVNLLPDINFIIPDSGVYTQDEIREIYKDCFCGIRPVKRDGQSQTVAEMGLMGRISLWDGDIPCSIQCGNAEYIAKKIRELQKGYDYKNISEETKKFFELNDNKFIKLVEKVYGSNEANNLKKYE